MRTDGSSVVQSVHNAGSRPGCRRAPRQWLELSAATPLHGCPVRPPGLDPPAPHFFLRGRSTPYSSMRLIKVRREIPSFAAALVWLPSHDARASRIR